VAHGARDWLYYPECIHRHNMQLLQQKYCQSLVVYAPPFWPSTPRNRGRAPYLPPPQAHDGDATEPHIRSKVYPTDAQPEDPSDSGTGHIYRTVAGPKHGKLSYSHGTFLQAALHVHVTLRRTFSPLSIHYISQDHPNAHELTNHILHPSPAPGLRSPGAPGKKLRMWCGKVPVSPTGTTGSFPRIFSMGMTKRTGFLRSSSYTTRPELGESQPVKL
jgi:hypothetical protein